MLIWSEDTQVQSACSLISCGYAVVWTTLCALSAEACDIAHYIFCGLGLQLDHNSQQNLVMYQRTKQRKGRGSVFA